MKLNIWKLILDADPIVQGILVILVIASVVSWAIIFQKRRLLRRSIVNSKGFVDLFWEERNMDNILRKAEAMVFSPTAAVFRSGYRELQKSRESALGSKGGPVSREDAVGILENVERALRRSATGQLTELERRIPFLATTGSSAPFIGLFGTVWGIMNSFLSIGGSGASNIAVVAPGIAEALVATAVGLIAAIPSVIGYNYCVSQVRVLQRDMDNFSNDFLNVIKRQLGAN